MGAREAARLVCNLVMVLPLLIQLELGVEAGRPIIECGATEGEVSKSELPLICDDLKRNNIGVDCSGWPLNITESAYVGQAEIAPPALSGGGAVMSDPDSPSPAHRRAHPPPVTSDLSPCTSRGQVPGFDCWPPIDQPSAICIEGIDCFDAPPAPILEHEISYAETASSAPRTMSGGNHVRLPSCDFAGAIPGWNCNVPPAHRGTDLPPALPPCGFEHRRPGFDCLPRDWYSPVFFAVTIPASDPQSSARHGRQWPAPCYFPGTIIPGWDCFGPPTEGDLPPCDFRHQRAAIICWPSS